MSCKFLFGRRNANILRRALDMHRALGKPCVKYYFAWGNLSPTFVEEENNSQYSLMTVDGMNGFYLHGSCQLFWEFWKITGSTNRAQTKSVFNMAPQASRAGESSILPTWTLIHRLPRFQGSRPTASCSFPQARTKGPCLFLFSCCVCAG